MGIILLLFIFGAPVTQIVLSNMRIKKKINLSIGAIAFVCLLGGIILSVAASVLAIRQLSPGVHCVTGEVSLGIFGVFISLVATPIVAIVSWIAYNNVNDEPSVTLKYPLKYKGDNWPKY